MDSAAKRAVWVWCDSEQAPSTAYVRGDVATCQDCGATDHDRANADGTFTEPEGSHVSER